MIHRHHLIAYVTTTPPATVTAQSKEAAIAARRERSSLACSSSIVLSICFITGFYGRCLVEMLGVTLRTTFGLADSLGRLIES